MHPLVFKAPTVRITALKVSFCLCALVGAVKTVPIKTCVQVFVCVFSFLQSTCLRVDGQVACLTF